MLALAKNTVNVYETGIFKSEGSGYDGSGMVVAVLDTGLDYYHSAFSELNFDSTGMRVTIDTVRDMLDERNTSAESKVPGLTAEDVYISTKVPYGFDYADVSINGELNGCTEEEKFLHKFKI